MTDKPDIIGDHRPFMDALADFMINEQKKLQIAVEMLQKETEHHSKRCSCFLCSTLSRIKAL